MRQASPRPKSTKASAVQAEGRCICGAVRIEIDVPAVWAWHDHSPASRHAQGCAYATYIGSWKSRFRILEGEDSLTRFEDADAETTRSFCGQCGTPVLYERGRSPRYVNIPRAMFTTRTGREPRYHVHLQEQAEWIYLGEPLSPLKGFPGVMRVRPSRKPRTVVGPPI